MSNKWNCETYSRFLDLRTRPARDLLAAIPSDFQPKIVYDLGCGPGNSTILLKQRWPNARVIGTDNSVEMLNTARKSYPEIEFIEQDIAHFSPKEEHKIDCLFANASLQWLPDHETLFPQLLRYVDSGGIFAIQMPNNFHSFTHQTILRVLENSSHACLIKNLRYGNLTKPLYDLTSYYDLFFKIGIKEIQIWETKYFQEMQDHQDIFNWVKGTALTPILSSMDDASKEWFQKEYVKSISTKYPKQANGKVLLPFQRIFMAGKVLSP